MVTSIVKTWKNIFPWSEYPKGYILKASYGSLKVSPNILFSSETSAFLRLFYSFSFLPFQAYQAEVMKGQMMALVVFFFGIGNV